MVTRGFFGLRRPEPPREIPPGQYYETGFPTLTAGPAPKIETDTWEFTISRGTEQLARWDWNELMALPNEVITVDLHCVTKWSKLDSTWRGVSVDTLLEAIGKPAEKFVMITSYGGYTTNL
ncbi:MAG: molybdopterin-dependent oxidoreductase, partial [Chloroflexi bacterium]|nr:molybdopterin-dependent oxidoreductase [Chloroflexota bacterium]